MPHERAVIGRGRSPGLLLALLCTAGCEPGKTHILGRVPEAEPHETEPEPDAGLEPETGPDSGLEADAAQAAQDLPDAASMPEREASVASAAPDADTSDAAGGELDASMPTPDAAASGDAALVSCTENDDCNTRERPYCSTELGRCVECIWDRHCYDDEYCRDSTGTCVERR